MAYTVPKLKDFSPTALDKAIEKLLSALEKESAVLKSEAERKTFRDRWLARNDGILKQVNELWLKAAPKEAKREVGQRFTKLKSEVEQKVEAALNTPSQKAKEAIDISLPGIRRPTGAEHPIIRTAAAEGLKPDPHAGKQVEGFKIGLRGIAGRVQRGKIKRLLHHSSPGQAMSGLWR